MNTHDIKRYAAIEADRQARGEPVAWIGHSPTRGNGRRLFWTKAEARRFSSDVAPLYEAPQPQQIPEGFQPLETIKYWAEAYSNPEGDEHFMGHGMVVQLLKEYAQLRTMLEAAPQPEGTS